MAFDPASFGGGYGAGQGAGQRAAHAAQNEASAAKIEAAGAMGGLMKVAEALGNERRANAELQNEIHNKWIPYGVALRASLMARRVQKDDLIAALKAGDPTNADRIVQAADEHAVQEYDRLTVSNSKELREVNDIVKAEAEAGRLG